MNLFYFKGGSGILTVIILRLARVWKLGMG